MKASSNLLCSKTWPWLCQFEFGCEWLFEYEYDYDECTCIGTIHCSGYCWILVDNRGVRTFVMY